MAYYSEYPYTDPYRYNDDWLLGKMRELIEEWAAMQQQFSDLNDSFKALKEYVMNYFANLDIASEVENILNQWYANGKLESLLRQSLGGYIWSKRLWASIGGAFTYNSRGPLGESFLYYLIGNLGNARHQELTTAETGLNVNGPNSYYNQLLEYHGRTGKELSYFFFVIEKEDMENITLSSANVRAIAQYCYNNGITPMYFIYPPNNISMSAHEYQLWMSWRPLNMSLSRFVSPPYIPFLLGESDRTDTGLTPIGVDYIIDCALHSCFQVGNYFPKRIRDYVIDSENLKMTIVNVHYNDFGCILTVVCTITASIVSYTLPIAVKNTSAILTSANGQYAAVAIQSNILTIQRPGDSTFYSGTISLAYAGLV